MKARLELIDTVIGIGEDAQALLEIARSKAPADANLSQAEIKRIAGLIRRSEETIGAASELAKARRIAEIDDLQNQISDIEASLAVPLDPDTVDFLKRKRRNLRARLLDKQTKAALDFGGILSAAELGDIQDLLAEARQAVARRKKAARFIKNLFQIVELAGGIVRKANGIF